MSRLLFIQIAILINVSLILGQQTCDVNYTLYDGICYRFHQEPLCNYEEARGICLSDNADLVSIHNSFANAYVQNKDKNGLLIGLRYYAETDSYNWSDSSPLDYKNYADGFVEYHDFFGYCAKILKGKWTNVECVEDRLEFVCEKKANDVVITPNDECPNATAMYFSSGMLLSPGYPDLFDFDQPTQETGCYYRLAGKNSYSTKLKIDECFMDGTNGTITVYHGWDEIESNRIIRLDSDFVNREVVIDYNRVMLHFKNAAHGKYKITWNTFEAPPNGTEPDACPDANKIYFTPTTIFSPGYPNSFGVTSGEFSMNCQYRLFANDGYYIKIKLEELSFDDNNVQIKLFKGWSETNGNLQNQLGPSNVGKEVIVGAHKVLLLINSTSSGSYKIKWTLAPCKDGWKFFNDACYFFDTTVVHAPTAKEACKREQATLTSILSQEEQSYLDSFIGDCAWIGLEKSDFWRWSDGSPLSYINWCQGKPSDSSAFCALKSGGCWFDYKCSGTCFYVCKQIIKQRPKL